MTLTCSTDPNQPGSSDWFVTFNIQGDASLPVHFEGVNVSLDDGPVGGLATTAHGHMTRRTWAVADSKADDFVAWIAAGAFPFGDHTLCGRRRHIRRFRD